MFHFETTELTLPERGILATASAGYLDHFSEVGRSPISVYQQPALVTRNRKYYSSGQEFVIEWQDSGQPLPSWFDALMQGFVDLLTLPPDWDSYGAESIDQNVVREAMSLMNILLGPVSPAPRVVPLSSGGLQLEWHRRGIDLEIVFDPGEEPSFYSRNRAVGEVHEEIVRGNDQLLRGILDGLV